MKVEVKGYAIYHPVTKMYSRGGMDNVWSKKPKIWHTMAHVKNHLAQHIDRDYSKKAINVSGTYRGAVVVDVTTQADTGFDIQDHLLNKAKTIKQGYYKDYDITEK